MRRLWGAFVLFAFLSEGNARIIDSTLEEEKSIGGAFRQDNTREGSSEVLLISPEEIDEPVSVLSPTEPIAAGGGVRLLDPKFLKEQEKYISASDAPWWERFWSAVWEWF